MNNYILITFILILILIYIYYYVSTNIENFETISTRPCTVWFTDYKKECDEGLFHKDLKSIEYLRNNTLSSVDKQIESIRKTMDSNNKILQAYDGMTLLAIERKILEDSTKYINEEKQKLSNRNQLQIDLEQQKLDNRQQLARQYFYNMPVMKNENIRLQNTLNTLLTQQKNIQRSEIYTKMSNVYTLKKDNPDFRCKNEYIGWDEFNSAGNPNFNDFEKKTSSVPQRGAPYTWAFCHKTNSTAASKRNIDTMIENKKYPAIVSYNADVSPVTSSIRFNTFDQKDMMECDETLVTPQNPSIPNGLLQIKLSAQELITDMKVIKYKDNQTRFIDTASTKSLSDIDPGLLMTLFYDFILNIEKGKYQVYIYPKTSLVYRVYNLYYDNKCKRFFGDTKLPVGVSKAGDLFAKAYPMYLTDKIYTRDAISKQKIPFPTREYINPSSITSKTLDTILQNMRKSYDINYKIYQDNLNKQRIAMYTRDIRQNNYNKSLTEIVCESYLYTLPKKVYTCPTNSCQK